MTLTSTPRQQCLAEAQKVVAGAQQLMDQLLLGSKNQFVPGCQRGVAADAEPRNPNEPPFFPTGKTVAGKRKASRRRRRVRRRFERGLRAKVDAFSAGVAVVHAQFVAGRKRMIGG
jgi:hypothetical protein